MSALATCDRILALIDEILPPASIASAVSAPYFEPVADDRPLYGPAMFDVFAEAAMFEGK